MRRLGEEREVVRKVGKGRIRWGEEVEVLLFDKEEAPESICSKKAEKEKTSVLL